MDVLAMGLKGGARRSASPAAAAIVAAAMGTGCASTPDFGPDPEPARLEAGAGVGERTFDLLLDGDLRELPRGGDAGERRTLAESRDLGRSGLCFADLPTEHFDPPRVVVSGIRRGSPAWRQGVRRGDRVVSSDGRAPATASALAREIAAAPDGSAVDLVVLEPGGAERRASVPLDPRLGRTVSVRVPLVAHYERDSSSSSVSLGAGLLFHREAAWWARQERDSSKVHAVRFGLLADLFEYERDPEGSTLTLLWWIPIRW
jgi:hypothetical protein